MWGLCVSSFFHFPLLLCFFFPLKEFRSQLFPVRLKLWHRLSAGGVNYPQPTLHLKTKWMLLWFGGDQLVLWPYCVQGSCWFGDWVHACFRVVRKKRGAWSLALMWQGNRLQCFTPVCGVNLSHVPFLPCAPSCLIDYQQSSTWGKCQVCNWNIPQVRKNWMPRIIILKHSSFCSFPLELLLF